MNIDFPGTARPPAAQKSGQPVAVALACDERYFQGLYCTVVSLLLNLSPSRRVLLYILDGGVADESKERLARRADALRPGTKINWIPVNEALFAGFELGPNKSLMPYARIMLPERVAESKCLYLDSDILVFRDVAELFDTHLDGGCVLAAVPDSETRTLAADAPVIVNAFSLNPDAAYFNAGVVLMDLQELRKDGFAQRTLEFLRDWHGKYRFHDQSALNYCYAGRIAALPEHWNRPSWVFDSQADNNLDCLLHFTNFVPWFGGRPGPAQTVFEKFAAEAGLPVNRWSPGFRRTRFKWLLRNALSPARALGFPVVAALYQIAGNHEKASAYREAGRYWQEFIRGSVRRVRRHRERGRRIQGMRFVAEAWLAAE